MTKIIYTSRNQEIFVSDEDYDFLNQFKWKINGKGYACRNIYLGGGRKNPKYRDKKMHRVILNAPDGLFSDHINGIRHDNQRTNLRLCTAAENARNSGAAKHKVHSKYIGVTYCVRDKWYVAQLRQHGKHLLRKGFKDEIDAAKAYDEAAIKYHGEFARLNFPK